MSAKKSVLKVFIIIILGVFLLSTGLISVLYLGGNKNTPTGTGDVISGVVDSGIVDESVDSNPVELPKVTKEEASQKIQELLSGITTSE